MQTFLNSKSKELNKFVQHSKHHILTEMLFWKFPLPSTKKLYTFTGAEKLILMGLEYED